MVEPLRCITESGFPHGEGDQRRFGGGSVSGRGCCRSRECRCNGGSDNMLNEDDGGEGNATELWVGHCRSHEQTWSNSVWS